MISSAPFALKTLLPEVLRGTNITYSVNKVGSLDHLQRHCSKSLILPWNRREPKYTEEFYQACFLWKKRVNWLEELCKEMNGCLWAYGKSRNPQGSILRRNWHSKNKLIRNLGNVMFTDYKNRYPLCIKFLLAADFPISLVRTPDINDKSISTSS